MTYKKKGGQGGRRPGAGPKRHPNSWKRHTFTHRVDPRFSMIIRKLLTMDRAMMSMESDMEILEMEIAYHSVKQELTTIWREEKEVWKTFRIAMNPAHKDELIERFKANIEYFKTTRK